MNKVLIVDDEKLVRQGIMTTFPWGKHGFEVACSAGSGEQALELLEREEVDLLVTDLAMNGMSGLELIKRARQLRRDLPVVVLTCHDNFRYIQEAMRLGVLDYIVKTEIEDEVVDETLMRIAGKLNGEQSADGGAPQGPAPGEPAREGLLLCGPARSSMPADLLAPGDREGWAGQLAEVDAATWLLRTTGAEADRWMAKLAPALEEGGWICVRLTGIDGEDDRDAAAKLRRFRRRALFYRPDRAAGTIAWRDLPEAGEAGEEDGEAAARLRTVWNRSDWVHDEELFERQLRRTAEAGLDAEELRSLFYPVALEWERLLNAGVLKGFLGLADAGLYWAEWEAWLRDFRAAIRRAAGRNATRQIADAILQAAERIRTGGDLEISEEEMARAANMSRGYFSKSFKKVTGRSYGEYVRLVKLERAKEMLLRTDEPITRVAELCGFSDYRHFSRVFRDYTGKLPTDYRKAGAGDGRPEV
ncbi:response regulator transcription factor [Cohnella zeiphila]|uniref:Response regulator n=1 Tax=Cohnella zeiphila TaxID=2761120 RepID=A0A7X0SIM5_9BACL|nr:helix-turn-helix domain-containing protein [Cohnella zeiphila]MBB6730652.1 response regulator [Cohnella zeiphila]